MFAAVDNHRAAHDHIGHARRILVNIDLTAPTVTYGGNAGTYTADQQVNVTCAAADGLSEVASDTCQAITGPAHSFGLGESTFSATATDKSGNVGSGATSFAVIATTDSVSNLTLSLSTSPSVAGAMNAKLTSASASFAKGNTAAANNQIDAFINQVNAQAGKKLTADQAATLIRLALALKR